MEGFAGTNTDLLGSTNPRHTVVGVVDNEDEVGQARAALLKAGFAEGDIRGYGADELVRNNEEHEANKGLVSRLFSLFPSQEDDLMKAYLAEAENGACFVTVYAPDNAARDRAAQALRSVEARHLRYYADMTIVDLSTERPLMPPQG